jgi:WD40 repeat protein
MPEVGGYEMLGVLGRGGMGVVYKARQLGLNRSVALKMIAAGRLAGPDQLARFRAEAEAVARLQHPHIVQIYEIGAYEGVPYFSLEFVDGGSLDRKLAGSPQPAQQAAEWLESLARAAHYAHEQGIVHRDLKPANVLLTAEGQLKITDFGLAKQLDSDNGRTASGAIMGTPSYMAPEQATGRIRDIGPPTDVFALGAILYETLTGRPPFKGATVLDTLDQVLNQDPVPPSRLNPQAPPDLDTITLKCLEKSPERRYPTAAHLADDLHRFLNVEPILARPVGLRERLGKWARRRPAVAALLALVLLIGGAGLAGILWQLGETEFARRQADANATAYRTESEKAKVNEATATNEANKAVEALKNEKAALANEKRHLYVAHMNLVQRHWERAEMTAALELLKRHIPGPGQPDNRGFEWYYYWRMLHSDVHALKGLPGAVRSLAFSPTANLLAIACEKDAQTGTLLLWDANTRRPPEVISKEDQSVVAVAFSPDGRTLAFSTAWLGKPGVVKLWDVEGKKVRKTLQGHRHPVLALAFSPDGKTLASGSAELKSVALGNALDLHQLDFAGVYGSRVAGFQERAGEIKLWDPQAGAELPGFKPHIDSQLGEAVLSMTFSDDERLVAGHLRYVAAYNLPSRQPICTMGPRLHNWSVSVHPQGRYLAAGNGVGSSNGETCLLYLVDKEFRTPGSLRLPAGVLACAFSPGGKTLATADMARTVRLWDWNGQEETGMILGHTDAVCALAFTPGGRILATGSWDRSVKFWDLRSPQEWISVDTNNGYDGFSVQFSPDGKQLLTQDEKSANLWDARTLDRPTDMPPGSYWYARDGRLCISTIEDGVFTTSEVAKGPGRPMHSFRVGRHTQAIYSPDMNYLATATWGGPGAELHVRSTATGRDPVDLALGLQNRGGHAPAHVRAWAFSPDGKRLAAVDGHHNFKIWDAASGRELAGRWLPNAGSTLAFAPDGSVLALGGDDGAIHLVDPVDLREVASLKGAHHVNLRVVRFSRNSRHLFSGDREGGLTLWDLATREERLTLRGPRHNLVSIDIAPDERAIAVGYQGRAVVFRGASDEEVQNGDRRPPFPELEIPAPEPTARPSGGFLGVGLSNDGSVNEVVPGSAADKAGLKVKDVILTVGKDKFRDVKSFLESMQATKPGDVITLRIKRGDEELDVKATLSKRPSIPARPAPMR